MDPVMTPPASRALELLFFDAGGGHRSVAIALLAVLAEQAPHWRVQLVDLQ